MPSLPSKLSNASVALALHLQASLTNEHAVPGYMSSLDLSGAVVQTLMLKPALALVSINITLNSRALASPSSMDTCLHQKHIIKGDPGELKLF